MIHKQFLSRDGNATILPPLHCHRQKSIARVSVALNRIHDSVEKMLADQGRVTRRDFMHSHPRFIRALGTDH
jgi:hypothetical protein